MTDHAFSRFRTSSFAFLPALFLAWIGGISFGCSLYEPLPLILMRSVVITPMSIVGVFVCEFLPLACTYFSFLLDKPIIILIVCFLKAAAYGYTVKLISCCFLSAGWLVQLLFLFSDSCLLFLLFFIWIYHVVGRENREYAMMNICSILCVLIIFADVYVIHPFLEGLF